MIVIQRGGSGKTSLLQKNVRSDILFLQKKMALASDSIRR